MWYIYIYIHYGILFSLKKDEILPFAATCMDLEFIILSKESDEDKYHITHKWQYSVISYMRKKSEKE